MLRSCLLISCLWTLIACKDRPPPPHPEPSTPPINALEDAIRTLARTDAYWMIPYEPPHQGIVSATQELSFLQTLVPGHCYKLLASQDGVVHELDLSIITQPQTELLQRSKKKAAAISLGLDKPLCPAEPALLRVILKGDQPTPSKAMVMVYRSQ